MERLERWFSLCVLIVAITFFIGSFQYPMFGNFAYIGEAFVPRIVSAILICLVGLYVWGVFKGKVIGASDEDPTKKMIINQIALAVLLFVSLFLINILGMLPTLGLFILVSLHYLERVSWLKSVVFTVVSIVSMFIIFDQLLGIRLPQGIFL